MSDSFIKDFWDKQGLTHGASHEASWGDIYAITLEINAISNHIKDGDKVLDAGCANGYSTFKQHASHEVKEIIGIDYSEPLIKAAKDELEKKQSPNISFFVNDVRDLPQEDDYFDIVYTTRVLINLPNWEEQIKAFEELYRVTKPGGKIVLSEAFWEPLCLLNSVRILFGLNNLVEHDFNRYLKKNKLEEYFISKDISFRNEDFSSIYYFGSRVLRELVHLEDTSYTNKINMEFFLLQDEVNSKKPNVGIQQLYVITKG